MFGMKNCGTVVGLTLLVTVATGYALGNEAWSIAFAPTGWMYATSSTFNQKLIAAGYALKY